MQSSDGTTSALDFQESGLCMRSLCDEVFHSIKAKGQLSERDMVNLHMLYGKTLSTALGLNDKDLISKIISESNRTLFLVQGSQAEPYVCFEDYCPCHFFNHKVVVSQDYLACKHVLAVRIADALGRVRAIRVTNEQFAQYLQKQSTTLAAGTKSPGSAYKRYRH